MFVLPFDAKATCSDGHAGTSTAVTLNRATMRISHLVVADGIGQQRLVPLNLVDGAGQGEIWLSCTQETYQNLPLFLVTEFIERAPQQSGDWAEEEGEWEDGVDLSQFERTGNEYGMPVQVENVPDGEEAFHRSTDIEATDDHVGVVEKLVMDLQTGQVTHLVMQKGHLWGKKDLMIPLSAVDHIDYHTVYLNVDKKVVENFEELS